MAKTEIPLKYDANRIIGVHGLERGLECDYLDKILNSTTVIEPEFEQYLENHRQALRLRGEYWNEEELKMNFLAHVFYVAQLREDKKIDIFYERPLSWEFGGKTERVICDCLLAKPFGIYAPQTPYFFLQEFKKQKQNEDAEGQMLLAMLIVQAENANKKPIYGCYLQGKNWVFTTLHDKNYCVSRQYDATQMADLQQIVAILRQLKKVILTELL
ncbi:MAG: hypothetical protein RLZZ292_1007 [Bacteroidota bacterium]|jgi:hypothetical protein